MMMKGIFFHTNSYSEGDLRWQWWVLITVILCISIPLIIIAGTNIAWREGVETTVTGTVQLHILRYNKLINMHYTDMELRTYSGDTHHVGLVNHWDFEMFATYTVRYRIVNYWWHVITVNEVVEIIKMD